MKTPKIPRRRQPQLLALVYLISLAMVAVTAVTLTTVVGNGINTTAVNASIRADRALVSTFVETSVSHEDLMGEALTPERQSVLEPVVEALAVNGIVRIKMYAPDGTVLLSNDRKIVGTEFDVEDDISEALAGVANGDVLDDPNAEPDLGELGLPVLLEEYLPVQVGGSVVAVFEVYRDAAPILAQADDTRNQVLFVTLGAAGFLFVFLYFVFRSADGRLKRQTREIMEATRRDSLTGMLNHGAVVEELARQLDSAMPQERRVGLALVDVDNLRLLNDTHGHAAGDAVLRAVADILRAEVSSATIIGRYGPDEFLCVAPPECVHDLAPAIERMRDRLRDLAPQFGESERLPVTTSVGICTFPEHGRSMTELLSVVAVALSQAKMSGGDQVRWAEIIVAPEAQAERASFDVLQGLVIAIDTKDRYTKRHSEDVARYAVFLADQLGLAPEWRRTVYIAGLLHDIGKIGIPDAILRKPAPLNADEYQIVKQHVTLGNMIVRDLPHLDLVRGGIRFHHEQWDGGGYPEGLKGEEIPLVARIISVADAFSAMTTSRTYRKALPLEEALQRLKGAAGTQLDPSLVMTFVQGMETSTDAPAPLDERRPQTITFLPDVPGGTTAPQRVALAATTDHAPSAFQPGQGGSGNRARQGARPFGRLPKQEESEAPPARIPSWLAND